MASTTGIEIGPDSFLFVSARSLRAREMEVRAVHRFDAAEWPGERRLLPEAIRTIRRGDRLSNRAAVVLWSTCDGIVPDPLETLSAAGFEITSVITPPQA